MNKTIIEQPDPEDQNEPSLDPKMEQMQTTPLSATRLDLTISPQLYLGKTVYVVKDPVSLTYFRLKPAEHFIFHQLDGNNNAKQIAELANNAYPDEETTPEDILRFVATLRASGLLLGKGAGHATFLRKVRDTRKKKMTRAKWLNFLFIKVPVLDPDQALNVLYRYCAPIMNPFTAKLGIIFIIISTIMGLASLSNIGKLEFPILGFFNLFIITCVFFTIKVIHEFGHGLAAKHRGLEVHEMGILFMVFIPMFYVDVSDAWMVPRKKDRLWITAGGVFIEFLFASVAVWVWLNTDPGLVNQIAFDTMLSASITTLLFNINPLLRYDGYYFLMDWLEIPNLKAKAAQYVGWLARTFILNAPGNPPAEEIKARPIFMVTYSFAAAIYRWMIVFGIIILVWHILDPYGLTTIGALLGLFSVITMILLPMFKTLKFAWSVQTQNWRRIGITLAVGFLITAATYLILSIETEHTLERPIVILADQRQPIYAPIAGIVDEIKVTEGQWVNPGDVLFILKNDTIIDKLKEVEIELRITKLAFDDAILKQQRDIASRMDRLYVQLEKRVLYLKNKVDQLTIRAEIAGRVVPEMRFSAMLGLHLDNGMKLGNIISTKKLQAVVVLPQEDAALIHEGMSAKTILWSTAWQTHTGKVTRVTNQFIAEIPHKALAGIFGGEVDTVSTRDSQTAPFTPSVLAFIDLDTNDDSILIDGLTGRSKVILGSSTLGSQQWRSIKQAFNLDWWL